MIFNLATPTCIRIRVRFGFRVLVFLSARPRTACINQNEMRNALASSRQPVHDPGATAIIVISFKRFANRFSQRIKQTSNRIKNNRYVFRYTIFPLTIFQFHILLTYIFILSRFRCIYPQFGRNF